MNPKFRRIIVWVLLLSLILSLVPAVVLTAFADGTHDGEHTLSAWAVASDDNSKCQRHCTIEGCNYSEVQDHDYTGVQPTASGNDTEHYLLCKVCAYQKAETHTYDQTVITDGFKTSTEGFYYYSCVCGAKGTETFQVCTVTFNSNTVSATMPDPLTVVKGSKISAPSPAPTFEKKRFTGWKSGDADWNFDENAVNENITLTAQWVDTCTVTFADGGVSATMPESQTVDKDSKAVKPADPSTTENKRFKEWKSGETAWDFEQNPVTADVTLTAQWVDLYDVKVAPVTHGTVTAAPAKAAEGDTVTVTVTPDTGYELDTLTYTEEGSTAPINIENKTILMPAKAVTVTAAFKISDFGLEAAPAGDLFVGSTTQLNTSTGIVPITWESSDSTVASVSSTGLVTGLKAGTAIITATVDGEHKAEITVKVVALELALADKTVSGKTGAALPTGLRSEKLTLSLSDGSFVEGTPSKENVVVTNLPTGVDYDLERVSDKTVRIVLKGTPTVPTSAAITVKVKKAALANPPASPAEYTVPANENTKWNIVESVAITLDNGGIASADTIKGTVTISPEVAAPGENVTVSVTPKTPFKLKSVSYTVGSTTQKIGAINGRYTFKMPEDAAAATITVTYEMPHTSKTGDSSSKIKSFSLVDHETLKDAIVNNSSSVSFEGAVSAEQQNALANGGDYVFVLSVEPATSSGDKAKLDAATKTSAVKGAVYTGNNKYMDITLWFEIYNAQGEQVGSAIKITDTGTNYVSLAFDALRSPATRLYYVHNGGAAAYYSQESGSTNGNVKYSKVHLFSTYELVYTTTSDNPKTADPFHLPVWAAVFVLSGLALPAVIVGGRKHLL